MWRRRSDWSLWWHAKRGMWGVRRRRRRRRGRVWRRWPARIEVEALGNGDLAEFAKILDEIDELTPLCLVSLGEEVCAWKLPQEILPTFWNRKTFKFLKKNWYLPIWWKSCVIVLSWVIAFTTIVVTVSQVGICRSIQEAFALLPFTSISVKEPLPVRLEDEHHLSTIWGQLDLLTGTSRNFVNILIDEKTSLFVLIPPSVLYIDTYSHLPVIVKGSAWNLRTFCRMCVGIRGARGWNVWKYMCS